MKKNIITILIILGALLFLLVLSFNPRENNAINSNTNNSREEDPNQIMKMPLLDNSVIKEDNEVKEEIKNNHQYTIGTCPTYEKFAEKMKEKGFKIIKNSSTAENIAMLRKGIVDYVLSGRVLKPQEGNWDSIKISNSGYSFISSKDIVVYTKDLSNKNIYTDLNPNELKMHFNLNKVEKVNNAYDYLEEGIVITSWENTDYSKANIVHVINEENGSRNIFSRSLFLYCKDKCNNNIINIIKEEV